MRGKGAFVIEATTPGTCQVRSKTEIPCRHRAVVEIRGIPFCGACAREQEAYFAIGELTRETRGQRRNPLAEALKRRRMARAGGTGDGAAETHQKLPASTRPSVSRFTQN
jgi:hypothetical protein